MAAGRIFETTTTEFAIRQKKSYTNKNVVQAIGFNQDETTFFKCCFSLPDRILRVLYANRNVVHVIRTKMLFKRLGLTNLHRVVQDIRTKMLFKLLVFNQNKIKYCGFVRPLSFPKKIIAPELAFYLQVIQWFSKHRFISKSTFL